MPGTGHPVRRQRVVAVQCGVAQTNRLAGFGNWVDNLDLRRHVARRVVVLTSFPPTPLALSRPSLRQLSPTKAPNGVLGQPIDDAVEAAAFVERPATVLVRYVVPRYPAAARSQRPAASLPVRSHSSRPSNRCPRSVGRAAGRRGSVRRDVASWPKTPFFGATLGALSVACCCCWPSAFCPCPVTVCKKLFGRSLPCVSMSFVDLLTHRGVK
jgi:hypothetical protein